MLDFDREFDVAGVTIRVVCQDVALGLLRSADVAPAPRFALAGDPDRDRWWLGMSLIPLPAPGVELSKRLEETEEGIRHAHDMHGESWSRGVAGMIALLGVRWEVLTIEVVLEMERVSTSEWTLEVPMYEPEALERLAELVPYAGRQRAMECLRWYRRMSLLDQFALPGNPDA